MPKILHIFDVSPFIHAGHINKNACLERAVDIGTTWRLQVTPAGGTSLIFNTLYDIVGRGDIVFCCDRNPTIKKDMLPTYKSNRHHDRGIEVERGVCEYILQECGFTVLARAGYEADDIIYSLVKKFYNNYDEIYIYTGDSDLYFLVDDKVSIKPSSSIAKEVTRLNYEKVLEKKGSRYNTLTVQKIIKGDSSDCIPALPKDLQLRVAKTLYHDEFYHKLGDREFVRSWVEYLVPEALSQVDLVFPLDVTDLPDNIETPDKKMIMNFGSALRNSRYRGPGTEDFDIKYHLDVMQSKGYYVEEDN